MHINTIMQSLNIYDQMGDAYRAQENYNWNTGDGKASACIQCGACESVCPQHIEIVSQLERAVKLFELRWPPPRSLRFSETWGVQVNFTL